LFSTSFEALMQDIGSYLRERGLVTERDLQQAVAARLQIGGSLGLALVRLGALSENDLVLALSTLWGLPPVTDAEMPDLASVQAALDRLHINPDWIRSAEAVVWFAGTDGEERLCIAARDPLSSDLQEAAEQWHPEPAIFYVARQQDLEGLLAELDTHGREADLVTAGGQDAKRLREMAEEAPAIDFVNAVFNEAVAKRASDIHIEPFENYFTVRLRVDGILGNARNAPRSQYDAISSRIKLLSQMDIAERRLPQDGRQSIRVGGREVDLRVSTLPTTWGESLVLRLLGKSRSLPELSALGVEADHCHTLDNLIACPNGVILVTGPTGSGKTTTIYRLLSQLNDGVRKIVTVEDPVEFDLPGVMQVHVRADIGLSFAAGLRSILRQDPDVIMVGEIRDSETARIAVQAALTGHLVISSVHTNSALAAVSRLLDLGVEDYLLADVLRGVVGQRLVRSLCQKCAQPVAATPEHTALVADMPYIDLSSPASWRQPGHCPACNESGYLGRSGIYEVMPIDGDLQAALRSRPAEEELLAIARRSGHRTMRDDGLLKARRGVTTVAEVLRVVGE
jgi:general secretion pathway protein E